MLCPSPKSSRKSWIWRKVRSIMDWAHLHLALNHIPVIGVPFLCLLLAWGWWRKTNSLIRLALWWTVVLAALSIAIKFTGDFAAEQSGGHLDPVRSWVNAHEQMADRATTAVFFLGLSASLVLFVGRNGRTIPRWLPILVLAIGFSTAAMLGLTANAGGKIGHANLR